LQKQPHADLRQLFAACTSQEGSVYGSPAVVDLAAPVIVANTQGTDELVRQLKSEKEARAAAEKQAREADERARRAEAREAEERAKRQAEAREAEERAKQAEARETEERAKRQAEAREAEERAKQAEAREAEERAMQVEAKANTPSPPPAQAPSGPIDNVAALQALEKLLDPHKVRRIQVLLAKIGFYQGPIDAIIGPLTRDAIKRYQRLNGTQETGYLTPDELKALTSPTP
jgi:hypothetical protein